MHEALTHRILGSRLWPTVLAIILVWAVAGTADATVSGTLYTRGGSTNDRIEVANTGLLNPTGGITIEAWVYPTSTSGCMTVVGKGFSEAYWLGLCNGRIRYYTSGSGTSYDGVRQLPINTWTHVAVTFDGTTRRYFIDGVQDQELVQGDPLPVSSADLGIGGETVGAIPYTFAGYIAEVRLWDHARSQADIRRNVSRQIREEEPGLIGVWNLVGSFQDALGRFSSTRLDGAAMIGAAAPPEPFSPMRIPRLSSSPSVDGNCTGYGSFRVPIYYPDGFGGSVNGVVWAWLGATADSLYACLDHMIVGIASPEAFAAMYIDPDASDDFYAQTDDFRLTATQTSGTVEARFGNGSGSYSGTVPTGWTAARGGFEFSYNAEFRVLRTAGRIPTDDSVFGLQLMQHWLRSVGDDAGFPVDYSWNQPSRWIDAFIDDSIVPPADWSPPSVSVSHTPATASDVTDDITIRVRAQDSVDLAEVTVFVDGVAVAGQVYPGASDTSWEEFEHTDQYPAGSHNYWAIARDGSGRVWASNTGNFTSYVEGLSPRISLRWLPLNPDVGDTVTLIADVRDDTGVAAININVDWGSQMHSCVVTPATNFASCSFDFRPNAGARMIRFFASASDLDSHITVSDPRMVILGNSGGDTDGDGVADTVEAALCTDPSNPDTDRDGLKDGDELFGKRFPDGDVVDLPGLGANPCYRDVFVQYDYERGARVWPGVVNDVRQAFRRNGVRLHVEENERPRPPTQALSPLGSGTAAYQQVPSGDYWFHPKRWWTHYYAYSRHLPGRSGGWYRFLTFDINWDGSQRACSDNLNQFCDSNADCSLGASCVLRGTCSNNGSILCDSDTDCSFAGSSGVCQITPGSCECPLGYEENELGCWGNRPGATPCLREGRGGQARRLMHEFGHAMGLGHGGRTGTDTLMSAGDYIYYQGDWDGPNRKPNYLSVMNYTYNGMNTCMLPPAPGDTNPRFVSALDYNPLPVPDLTEANLSENPASDFATALQARSCTHAGPGAVAVAIYTCRDPRLPGLGSETEARVQMVTDGQATLARLVQGSGWELFATSPHAPGIDWNCNGVIGGGVSENINGDSGDYLLPPGDEICGNSTDDNGNGEVDEGCAAYLNETMRGNQDWQYVPSPPSCLNPYKTDEQCYIQPGFYRAEIAAGAADCRGSGQPDQDCPDLPVIFSYPAASREISTSTPTADASLSADLSKGQKSQPNHMSPPDHDRPGDLRLDNLEWPEIPDHEICNGVDDDGDLEVDEGCADTDADTVSDAIDNCPETPNTDQADRDGNGLGDACQNPGAIQDIGVDPGNNEISLFWSPPAADLLGYTVYWINPADVSPVYLGSNYPSTEFTSWTVTGPAANTGWYQVHPVNLNGVEGPPATYRFTDVGELFIDGFESGDSTSWSGTTP